MQDSFAIERGAISVERRTARLVSTTLAGHVTRQTSEEAVERFAQTLLRMELGPVWIGDAIALTGFDRDAYAVGRRWFEIYRACGGVHVVVASRTPMVIMAASALAIAFGIRIHSGGTLAQAEVEAQRLLRNSPTPAPRHGASLHGSWRP